MTGSAQVPGWVDRLFRDIDRKDTEAFLGHLADDVEFRFGSSPAVAGKGAVGDAVGAFFESIAALRHTVENVWEGDASTVCEGMVTYTRHDGREVPIPFTDVFDHRDGEIDGYRIYIDMSPLFEA